MKKSRTVDEDYEVCDFCGAELCEKCGFVADHDPRTDWQGMSDCYGWASEEICCCSQFFWAKEVEAAEKQVNFFANKLQKLKEVYEWDTAACMKEWTTAKIRLDWSEKDYNERFPK